MSEFQQRLALALLKGEFARAWALLIVYNQIEDFAKLTSQLDFDIAAAWDEDLIESHINFQRKQQR